MSLGNEQLLTPFVASTLLQTWARQIPRPTAPLRRRLRRWSHSSFPATPPSGWRNCPKSSTPASQAIPPARSSPPSRSEEHTSELQSRLHLVCRLLLEKKKSRTHTYT